MEEEDQQGVQEGSIRVIIQFYYDFLRKKTAAVDIENQDQDTLVLLKAISVKVDRPLHEIVATIKKDNISVRIIAGWPLWFYEIKDKACVNVEIKDAESDESNRRKSSALNSRYLQKLGFNKEERTLSIIKDFEEEENDDDNDQSFRKFRDTQSQQNTSPTGSWKKNSQRSGSSSDEDDGQHRNLDIKKMLENYLETLIWECKSNHLEEVKRLLSDTPTKIAPQQLSELMVERQKVINEIGKDGFNPLHRAIQQKSVQIVQELLNHGANVNVPNFQGWTSVQIAIHKDDLQILKMLLESPTFDMQYVSQIGTALTVACQFSKLAIIPLLLEKNPTFELEPYLELCKNEECLALLKAHIRNAQQKKEITIPQTSSVSANSTAMASPAESTTLIRQPMILLPPKPPIVRGVFYKMGALLFNIRERYFVLNPDEGTLIRYKQPQHYPLRPLEVIPLKQITVIQEIQKSWFMPSDYSYFEINFPGRQVLACKNNQTTKKWIEYLFMASVYSLYTESRNEVSASQLQDNVEIELIDSPKQQPIVGQIGGNVRDAVKAFEIQSKKLQNNGQQQQMPLPNNNTSNNNSQNSSPVKDNNSNNNKKSNNIPQPQKNSNGGQQRSLSPQNTQPQQQQQPNQQQTQPQQQQPKKSTSPQKTAAPVRSSSDVSTAYKNGAVENIHKRSNENEPQEDAFPDLGGLQDEKITFESFQILKVLGAGSFGKVFLAKKKDTQNVYAIKALKKRPLIMKRQLRYAVTEANVLKMCSHPFVLGLHFALQTPNFLYLVLDYCSGGDISSHLAYKRRFKEEETVFYIAELVLAIQYIHEKDVVYRDLKPENILIAGDGHIKLADFGLSKDNVTDQSKTKSFCGTPAYLSPEMLNNKGATKASDLYGIGAVLYEMLTGDPPYYNDDIPTMYKKIKEGNLTYPSYVSSKARNIINGLLDRNPKTRLGASDKEALKRDPFFEKIDWEKLYNKQYTPPITEFENIEPEEDFEDPSEKNVFTDFDYQPHNQNTNRVKNFSFSRK